MIGYGISKSELKTHNRIQILRTIWECGPISRADIAQKLCITRAAITVITNEMIEERVIKELGKDYGEETAEVSKGRRKVLLDIDSSYCFFMGVYIDKSNISIGLTTINCDILEKANLELNPDASIDAIVSIIDETADRMLGHSCLDAKQLLGAGVGVMPDMLDMLCKSSTEEDPDFSALQNTLSEKLGMPVFAQNAVSLLALVCCGSRKRAGKYYKSAFLLAGSDGYRLSLVYKRQQFAEMFCESNSVDSLCVRTDGRSLEGYCNGSVRAELTAEGIGRKAAGIYSSSKTPALYKLTDGDGSRITLAQVMTAFSEGDEALCVLRKELLDEMCLLLNNIACLYEADSIYLYRSGLTEEQLQELRLHGEIYFDKGTAGKLMLCNISDRERFVCGCSYAVLKGFFDTGGISPENL